MFHKLPNNGTKTNNNQAYEYELEVVLNPWNGSEEVTNNGDGSRPQDCADATEKRVRSKIHSTNAGLFIASGYISMNIWLAAVILTIAAFTSNLVGYWIGYKVGPPLFSRPNSRLFKQEYVEHMEKFFKRYGGRAIINARFTPIM